MSSPTEEDWLKIHQKAWTDPDFRQHLESDPTGALHAYGKSVNKTFTKLVTMPDKPDDDLDDMIKHKYKAPPACC